MYNKPRPLYLFHPRVRCPVCGEASYSAAGIHPQCAMRQADAKRTEALKRLKRLKLKQHVANLDPKPWHRICPECRTMLHVRRAVCICGHKLQKD